MVVSPKHFDELFLLDMQPVHATGIKEVLAPETEFDDCKR